MRDVNSLPGLHKLRTMVSSKMRSIPRVQSSSFLDLYMMSKEKERLLKESERLGRRDAIIKKRLEEIERETSKLQEIEAVGSKASPNLNSSEDLLNQQDGAKKEWKKMKLNY